MTTILNLTQHSATPSQKEAGVLDLPKEVQDKLKIFLEVRKEVLLLPEEAREEQLRSQVESIVHLIWPNLKEAAHLRAKKALECFEKGDGIAGWNAGREPICQAMIGGAPYLVDRLKVRLKELQVEPLYAASERRSVEENLADGTVRKTQVFEHLTFVPA